LKYAAGKDNLEKLARKAPDDFNQANNALNKEEELEDQKMQID
jgi:hypothetical protein